ncbi:MAG TPA: phage tail assembly protein [Lamprocystis sp. (in: g-proteobacteria)]|nr:phage tail assembly protein [Lamprocystis sp. (in: g-proteobacteria)]
MTTVTLSTGLAVELRAPTAGDLRGLKLLDVLQLDTGAHAPLVERISEMTAGEFYALAAPDALAVMTGIVGFFAPSTADLSDFPPALKTPGP